MAKIHSHILFAGCALVAMTMGAVPAMAQDADLEAMEFALRLSNRRNVFTRKLHVLAFLIESDPRYVGRFLNDTPRRAGAFLSLGGHTLRAVWKLVRGRWLLRRLAAAHA